MGFFDRFKKKKQEVPAEEPVKEAQQKETPQEEEKEQPAAQQEQAQQEFEPASKESMPHPEDTVIKYDGDKLMAFALLNDNKFYLNQFRFNLKRDWGIEPEMAMRKGGLTSITFMIAGMTFLITHMPAPIPNHEAERISRFNYLWKDAEETVAQHKTFLTVALLRNPCQDRVRTCIQFTKVCGALMDLPNACAMFMGGQNLIISPQEYKKQIEMMKAAEEQDKQYLPIPLWVYIGLARGENGNGYGYTFGMRDFGKKEIEVLDHQMAPTQMYQLLNMMCHMLVLNHVELKDGDRVRLDDKTVVTMRLGTGAMVRGECFQIVFPGEEEAWEEGEKIRKEKWAEQLQKLKEQRDQAIARAAERAKQQAAGETAPEAEENQSVDKQQTPAPEKPVDGEKPSDVLESVLEQQEETSQDEKKIDSAESAE